METGHRNAGRLDIVMKTGHRNGDCSLYSGIEARMETAGHRNVGRLDIVQKQDTDTSEDWTDIVRKPDAEIGTVAYTLAWRTKTVRRMDTTNQTVQLQTQSREKTQTWKLKTVMGW